MISEWVLFKNEFIPVVTWYQSKVYSKRVISEGVYWGFHARTKHSLLYLYNIIYIITKLVLGVCKRRRRSEMDKDASRTFKGKKNQRPKWYVLRCFSLNIIPEISITRTILMIWLEPLEHIDQGIFIFGIFQLFAFDINCCHSHTEKTQVPI